MVFVVEKPVNIEKPCVPVLDPTVPVGASESLQPVAILTFRVAAPAGIHLLPAANLRADNHVAACELHTQRFDVPGVVTQKACSPSWPHEK